MNYLETICIKDCEPQNLEYHTARMRQNSVAELPDLSALNPLANTVESRVKGRVVYNQTDILSIEILPYTLPVINSLKVIESDSICYDRKYEDRSALSALYAQRGDCDDIIICRDGNVGDSYFCNLIFSSEGKLFTPDTPLLSGTKRQKLIDSGVATPCRITRDDLLKYEGVYLVNAMIDPSDNVFIPAAKIFL